VRAAEAMELQGSRTAADCRFAIVVARFNPEITEGLLSGARRALAAAGVGDEAITVVRVPGAFEIPLAAMRLAETEQFDAVIGIGALIKGDTMHFEYIAQAASTGIMEASLATGIPIAFGVLTTLTDEQAAVRAADNDDNKGREAALAEIEMATLFRQLQARVDA
jgi:6,7-dimethyl-8-ribityllumazine synthase